MKVNLTVIALFFTLALAGATETPYSFLNATRFNFIRNEPLPYVYGWPTVPLADVQQFSELPLSRETDGSGVPSALIIAQSQEDQNTTKYSLFQFSLTPDYAPQLTAVAPWLQLSRKARVYALDAPSSNAYNLLAVDPVSSIIYTINCSFTHEKSGVCAKVQQTPFPACNTVSGIVWMPENNTFYAGTDVGLVQIDGSTLQTAIQLPAVNVLSVAYSRALRVLAFGTLAKLYLYSVPLNLWRYEYARGYTDIPYALAFRDSDLTLWLASDEAVNAIVFENNTAVPYLQYDIWRATGNQQGLSVGNLTAVHCGVDGVVYFSGLYGVSRLEGKLEDVFPLDGNYKKAWHGIGQIESPYSPWRYLYEQRWMPSGEIIAMAPHSRLGLLVSTPYGVSVIQAVTNYTLAEKAARFQNIAESRHTAYGYSTATRLARPAQTAADFTPVLDDDNLGLWTNMYLAAQCLRYAVTKDEAARDVARTVFDAIQRLYKLVPAVNYGLMAKAAIPNASLPQDPAWHQSTTPGYTNWIYKAGTSSDDVTSYFYALPLYIEHIAETQAERDDAIALIVRTIEYIMANNWYLINVDGRPTNWGFWNPTRLNENPRYYSERYANSVEILSYLAVAYHYTRDEKYVTAMYDLGVANQYFLNIVNSRCNYPENENYSDDELNYLAFGAFFSAKASLPHDIVDAFKQTIKHSWAQVQKYGPSLWAYMTYAALLGDADLDQVVTRDHLRAAEVQLQQWPDLIEYAVDNSHRQDIVVSKDPLRMARDARRVQRGDERQTVDLTRLDEHGGARQWNGDPYELRAGSAAYEESNPTWFLLPYWYKRYLGL